MSSILKILSPILFYLKTEFGLLLLLGENTSYYTLQSPIARGFHNEEGSSRCQVNKGQQAYTVCLGSSCYLVSVPKHPASTAHVAAG